MGDKQPFAARIDTNIKQTFISLVWKKSAPNGETKYNNVGPAVEEALKDYIIKHKPNGGGVKQ